MQRVVLIVLLIPKWRLISATLCGWRRCFVADQLWFMTRIREEEDSETFMSSQRKPLGCIKYLPMHLWWSRHCDNWCVCLSVVCLPVSLYVCLSDSWTHWWMSTRVGRYGQGMILFFLLSERTPWSVAVSTICRRSSRVVAFLQAVVRPKFRGPRSASIAQSQVWLGLPAGRFQSGGTCRIHAARARWWSLRGELQAIWPKSRRRLISHQVREQWTTSGSSDFCNWWSSRND